MKSWLDEYKRDYNCNYCPDCCRFNIPDIAWGYNAYSQDNHIFDNRIRGLPVFKKGFVTRLVGKSSSENHVYGKNNYPEPNRTYQSPFIIQNPLLQEVF